jgi:dihydroorotase
MIAGPVGCCQMAKEYRERVMAAVPPEDSFEPLMTLYLTKQTTPEDIRQVCPVLAVDLLSPPCNLEG